MELQFFLPDRIFRNEILRDLEISELDLQYIKLIRENDEAYKSFHDLFLQLKGTTHERIKLINEVLMYLREQYI